MDSSTPTSSFNFNLKIVFWNASSISLRKEELPDLLKDIDILVCVGSWLNNKCTNFQFPGFVTFRKDRVRSAGGGVLLLIRKNIAYKEIDNLIVPNESVELCGVRITNTSPRFNLYACYRAPGDALSLENWETLFSNFDPNQNNVLMGDFNSHHVIWNCKKSDTNGKNLLQCIKNSNYYIHNTDMLTHIDITSTSNIDLIISSNSLIDSIETQAYSDTLGSDHYPIYVSLNTQKSIHRQKSLKIRSVRTNWINVNTDLQSS